MQEIRNRFARVVFNIPLNKSFSYRVPIDIKDIRPGMRVLAPFGRNDLTGVVVQVSDRSDFPETRSLIDVLDEESLLDDSMLRLTRWMADYYMCGWGQAVFLALPKGIEEAVRENIYLNETLEAQGLSERQRELYLLIGENPGQSKQYYRRKFGYGSFYGILKSLKEKNLVRVRREYVEPRVNELHRKFVIISPDYARLSTSQEVWQRYIARRPEVDEFLRHNSGKKFLQSEFLEKTRMAAQTLLRYAGIGLYEIKEERVERRLQVEYQEDTHIEQLTEEQEAAVNSMLPFIQRREFKTVLLHGVTGSGKTQVYIEILKKVLEQGRTAIILIPEIALTSQTVARFQKVVGDEIAIFHSRMSLGERLDYWHACHEGRIKCVVGPRSALFAPLPDIGLIVVDEEQEQSYKQTELNPRYNARDVAVYRGKLHNALVILGSATPSLESYYNSVRGKYKLVRMSKRVDQTKLPDVEIIDMRRASKQGEGDLRFFSRDLVQKIAARLHNKEQIILLQNRRGFSATLQCGDCGFIPVCQHCDVSLTYHTYGEKLQCHLCGHVQPAQSYCPNCGGKQLIYKGSGTQRIEKVLHELFPRARILRMDRDTTRGKQRYEQILLTFAKREADILLGTQMIAKGLDFANVTLVGVISADVGLSVPDFRSPERIFQLLTQVAGRAGRRTKQGEVVVQTFSPSHYAIQFAREHDYEGFYREEIRHREHYAYPPYCRMIQILISDQELAQTMELARKLSSRLRPALRKFAQVLGPAPAIIHRMNNLFRWVITLKLNAKTDASGKNTKAVLSKIIFSDQSSLKGLSGKITVDVDPLVLN